MKKKYAGLKEHASAGSDESDKYQLLHLRTGCLNKTLSLVKISRDKYNSSWREIHLEFLTNPCEAINLVEEQSLDSVC